MATPRALGSSTNLGGPFGLGRPSMPTPRLTDEERRAEFEKKLRNSKIYDGSVKKFVNARDMYGKTALHYACIHGNLEQIKVLLASKAFLFLRDNKRRKASELGKDLQIRKLIEREEQIFERKFENTEGSGLTPASNKPIDLSTNLNYSVATSLSGNGGEAGMRFMKKKMNLSKQAMSSYSNARLS